MPEPDGQTFREICERRVGELAERSGNGDGSTLVKAALHLDADIGRHLRNLPESDYPKARLLELLVQDLLNFAIEDNYVDLGHQLSEACQVATRSLAALLREDDWIGSALADFLAASRDIASGQLDAPRAELNGSVPIRGRLASPNGPGILVSTQQYPFVPILEDIIGEPELVREVTDAFATRLGALRDAGDINCLCFVEKSVGPVGALFLVSALVSQLGLPACIYRARQWEKRAKLVGYQPKPTDRLGIVYDLLVTGDGIAQAVRDLQDTYDAQVSAAVVLFAYDGRVKLDLGPGQESVRVEACDRYESFSSDIRKAIEDLRSGSEPRTSRLRLIQSNGNGRKPTPPPARRTARSSFSKEKGENAMSPSREWRESLESYRSLRALRFASAEEFRTALSLLWSGELSDVPRDLLGDHTIAVPLEAVSEFRSRGLDFEEIEVEWSANLTPEEIAELRREQGLHSS